MTATDAVPPLPPLNRADPAYVRAGLVLVAFFGLALGLTWSCQAPVLLHVLGFAPRPGPWAGWLFYAGTFGPALAGLIVAGLSEGRPGLARIGRSLCTWRVAPRWILLACALPAIEIGFHFVIARATGGEAPWPPMLPTGLTWFYALRLVLATAGEELGWRGYALPRLLDRHGPLVASLVLASFWAAWHLPTFFIPGMAQHGSPLHYYLLSVTEISLFMTLLYVRSGGSLPLAIFFHALYDTALLLMPTVVLRQGAIRHYEADLLFLGLLAVLMLAVDRKFWFGGRVPPVNP